MRWLLALTFLVLMVARLESARPLEAATAEERARVLELVNLERARAGLQPLWENPSLRDAAERYAEDMARLNFFSHTGLDGSTLATRAEAAGYRDWRWLGENIAAGQTSADAVFQAWMNSPGHRANILSPRAREIGIGRAESPTSLYRSYWTMELGDRAGATAPTPVPSATATPAATPVPTRTPTAVPTVPASETRIAIGTPGRYRLHIPSVLRAATGGL